MARVDRGLRWGSREPGELQSALLRCSTREQTLTQQPEDTNEWPTRNGVKVAQFVGEPAVSGAARERPKIE